MVRGVVAAATDKHGLQELEAYACYRKAKRGQGREGEWQLSDGNVRQKR